MSTIKSLILIPLIAAFLYACGAGGGGESNTPTPQGDTTYNIYGSVQKGPFIKGTTITVQELDPKLNPTGRTFSTTTTDDSGSFSLPATLSSQFIEAIATGYYFDEINNSLSSSPLTLRAVADLSTGVKININILNHLSRERIIKLVSGGLSYTEAINQSKKEIFSIFKINETDISSFDTMDITANGSGDAILLAISVILGQLATSNATSAATIVAELSQMISTISSDLSSSGTLSNANYIQGIKTVQQKVLSSQIGNNLVNRYAQLGQSITLPNFKEYLDCDGNGILNKYEPIQNTITCADSMKTITAFSFVGLISKVNINETAKTISVIVPYGTNVQSLVASFITTGSSVKVGSTAQVSGVTQNDFTNPIGYTVTDVDGTIAMYTVTTTVSPWTTKTAMSTSRLAFTVTTLNNSLYALGGQTKSGSTYPYLSTLERYDPSTDTWSTKTPMPTERMYLAAATMNGILYAVGGWNGSSPTLNVLEAYNFLNDSWTTKAPLPTPRSGLTAAVVNGILYAIGGYNSANLSLVEAYDPVANTWTTKPTMQSVRNAPAAAVINGLIYVVGGTNSSGYLSSVEVYDPNTNAWSYRAPMPTGRCCLSISVVNGILYAVGGMSGSSILDTVEAYDPIADTWSVKIPMPTPRSHLAGDATNGVLYAVGGTDGLGNFSSKVESYTP